MVEWAVCILRAVDWVVWALVEVSVVAIVVLTQMEVIMMKRS